MPRSFFSVVAKEALGAKPASEHVAAEIINAGMAQSADEVVTLPDGTIYVYQACPKLRNGKVPPDVPGIYIFVGRMMNGSKPAKRAAFNLAEKA